MIEVFLPSDKLKVKKFYIKEKYIFPIINSVIDGLQAGKIFVDNIKNPQSAFVLHSFGWSQIFGKNNPEFLKKLKKYILVDGLYPSLKIRNYTPQNKYFFSNANAQISERCKFRIYKLDKKKYKISKKFKIKKINSDNCEKVNKDLKIDLFSRFWPSKLSFINNSFGFLIEYENSVVSVIYSCGIYENVHEIDVFTHEKFRGKGLARIVSENFINRCLINNIIPNWDCFTNNEGSINLAKSLGYKKFLYPYKFYTVANKNY